MQVCELLQIKRGCDLMFYERFIQLCELNNEKPTNVLKSIGVSSGNLQNWKNGTSIKSDILMQLSEHFNVSTDYLLGRTENPNIINQVNTGDISNHSNVNVNNSNKTELDEMSQELLNKFKELPFDEKNRSL